MSTPRLIITIDGPAGTGKSTAADQLARRLGLSCLDTGAMYRCVALLAMRGGVDPSDAIGLVDMLGEHSIDFDWSAVPPQILLDGVQVEGDIRSAEVGKVVSLVAAVPEVRESMVAAQRSIAQFHPRLVSEGRDQGSVVFPDAQMRFFLDADVAERARRRVRQLEARASAVDAQAVEAEILARDRMDSTRQVGPLTRPEGAIVIDTSALSLEEVVDRLEQNVRAAVPATVLEPC